MALLAVSLVGPVLLFGVALVAKVQPGRQPVQVIQALRVASTAGLLAAFVLALSGFGAVAAGPRPVPSGTLASLVRVDSLSATILVMVAALIFVVARYSETYLEGDVRHGLFLGRLAVAAGAVEFLVVANHLALFWLAWVLTSVGLHQLLVFYRERPRAQLAAAKKFVVARLGDICLGASFFILFQHSGTADLSEIFSLQAQSEFAMPTTAGVLIALTAVLKSAQFPLHGWLVEVMETPTPVSALLHAGILNAGPFLILRFSPLLEALEVVNLLLVVIGGVTALFASVVFRTQSSVKVALGYSSAAHMGFSLMACGLGAYSAAALHLVAHSFYKAHAFLTAGSVGCSVDRPVQGVPVRRWRLRAVVLATLVATTIFGTIAVAMQARHLLQPRFVVLAIVIILGLSQLLGAGFDRPSSAATKLYLVLLSMVVTVSFLVLEHAASWLLADSLPSAPTLSAIVLGSSVALVVVWSVVVVIQAAGLGRSSEIGDRLRVHLRNGLYMNALFDRFILAIAPVASGRFAQRRFE